VASCCRDFEGSLGGFLAPHLGDIGSKGTGLVEGAATPSGLNGRNAKEMLDGLGQVAHPDDRNGAESRCLGTVRGWQQHLFSSLSATELRDG
jgi:hypothetical protein